MPDKALRHLQHYTPATVCCLGMPPHDGWVCFAFEVDGGVLRLRLPQDQAEAFFRAGLDYARMGVHACNAEGNTDV